VISLLVGLVIDEKVDGPKSMVHMVDVRPFKWVDWLD